jgi:hypothetical protein
VKGGAVKFRTESGSVYELQGRRIRRLWGTHPAMANQRGGMWREYVAVVPAPVVGVRPLVQWGWDGDVLRQTLLSEVVEFLDETIPGEHDAGALYYLGTPIAAEGQAVRRGVGPVGQPWVSVTTGE